MKVKLEPTADGGGRLTIPEALAAELGWDEGDEVAFDVVQGEIVVWKVQDEDEARG